MRRVKWKALWVVCWALILVADVFLDLRAQLSALVTGAERMEPDVFHYRLQTALLVVFVAVAVAPLLWPLLRRWLLVGAPKKAVPLARDPRDASLAEALSYLAHRSAWGAGRDDAGEQDLLREAAGAIEEAARRGRIELRGVPPGGGDRERVPPDHWLTAGIDLPATLDPAGAGGETAPRETRAEGRKGRGAAGYRALVIDRAALERLWPPDSVLRRTGRATARSVARSLRRGARARENRAGEKE